MRDLSPMPTIWADFNARAYDGLVWLTTAGSRRSLAETGARVGDVVWLSDDELRVTGEIVERDGRLLARPDWTSLEDFEDGRWVARR